MLFFLGAAVQRSWNSAVHNSLSPGQVMAESHLAQVLPLPRYSACFHRGLPPWVLKFAFRGPSAEFKLSCCQISRVQHTGSATKPVEGQEETPWISAGPRSSLKEGGQHVVYPGFHCSAMGNNSEHQDDVFYPQLKTSASGSHSPKCKGCSSYPS